MSNKRESRMDALASEAELWEYLNFHGETEDFERWVIGYRQSLTERTD